MRAAADVRPAARRAATATVGGVRRLLPRGRHLPGRRDLRGLLVLLASVDGAARVTDKARIN